MNDAKAVNLDDPGRKRQSLTLVESRNSRRWLWIGCTLAVAAAVAAIIAWQVVTRKFATGALGLTTDYQPTTDPVTVTAQLTFYGARDNCPPSGAISHASIHTLGGGTGTWADPITYAGATAATPAGTRLYVPHLSKYFIMEDDCQECIKNWSEEHILHFDLWIGPSNVVAGTAIVDCEIALDTPHASVLINPASDLTVDTTPLFNGGTQQCIVEAAVCTDVGTSCGNLCEIPSSASCSSLATMFSLSLSRFQALNPSLGCSGSVSAGTSVCMGGTCGD